MVLFGNKYQYFGVISARSSFPITFDIVIFQPKYLGRLLVYYVLLPIILNIKSRSHLLQYLQGRMVKLVPLCSTLTTFLEKQGDYFKKICQSMALNVFNITFVVTF
ncbi:uncharacterized protein VICG_00671 [Vittaforma corneae ATCC 50505]|uniref:Uncharacterized protein n=1 Tax=Vittaforma corneae (strain ATCC 50505) TaxID=993615 RepID=L2GN65_VITCO|nr:uncharacterized protein VICG_00671 [Vittaforma corneae ATCC 50505]ELA42271.1 hypothetical protein VICG_00671 [Vittaforma corneae ATCC 50505]